MPVPAQPLLQVRDLRLHFDTLRGRVHALNGVDLAVDRSEIVGLVGETGSGKTVTARSLLGLLPPNAHVSGGQIIFDGTDLVAASDAHMQQLRGSQISMVFQDARGALNPLFPVGHQLAQVAMRHQKLSARAARAQAVDALRRLDISEPDRRAAQYPHELSGGMCQRVMIAMALICSPKLILLDEPTTGLDVTVQAEVLDLLQHVVRMTGAAALLITHDLGVVARVCQRVAVMYAGRVVEDGPVEAVYTGALHPYTQALHDAKLDVDATSREGFVSIPGSVPDLRRLPAGCHFAPRCGLRSQRCAEDPPMRELSPRHMARCFHSEELVRARLAAATAGPTYRPDVGETPVRNPAQPGHNGQDATVPLLRVEHLAKYYDLGTSFFHPRRLVAVDDVSFHVERGEVLGLVGESGCGKSTVARCVLRLASISGGRVAFRGSFLHDVDHASMQRLRRHMQIVFQNPRGSLNPRMQVRDALREPLRLHLRLSGRALEARLAELMHLVGLDRAHLDRYPHQLSGGQQQRVGIARAIATQPEFIVLDEPTSSLDVSVQGQILQLLQRLQQDLGLSYLFISHDLSVIRHICQRVAVMYLGRIIETGTTREVFESPKHPYTQALLSAVPPAKWGTVRERVRLVGELPSPLSIPRGCRLSPRCPLARPVCSSQEPVLEGIDGTQRVACFAATGWPDQGSPARLP
jgi:peptide/nickel transport system ATP-binding protein